MISYGFILGVLFLCVGVIYDWMYICDIDVYGGFVNWMLVYVFVFMFFIMVNVGLLGILGFVGEFLILMGVFQVNIWVVVIVIIGVILLVVYVLWFYCCVVMGELIKESLKLIIEMIGCEKVIFVLLIFMILFLGIYLSLVIDIIGLSVYDLIVYVNMVIVVSDLGVVIVVDVVVLY